MKYLSAALISVILLTSFVSAEVMVESYTGGTAGVGGSVDISKLRCAVSITDSNCESFLFPTATVPHANRPVFIMLYSPACHHCQELLPHFDAIGYEALYGKGYGYLKMPANATSLSPLKASYSPSSPNPYAPQFAVANMGDNVRLRDVFPSKSVPSFVYTIGGHAYPYSGAVSAEGFAKAAASLTEAHFYSNLVSMKETTQTPYVSSTVPDISTLDTFLPFWADLTAYHRFLNPMGSIKTENNDPKKSISGQPLKRADDDDTDADTPVEVNLGITPPLFVMCLPPNSDSLYKPNKDLLEQAVAGAHPIVRPAYATFLASVFTTGRARFATLKASLDRKDLPSSATNTNEKKSLTDFEPIPSEIYSMLAKGCDSAFSSSNGRKPSAGPNGEVLMMYSPDRSSNPIFYHGASDGVSNMVSKKRLSGEGVAEVAEQATKIEGGVEALKTMTTNEPNSNEASHITTRIEPLISVIGAPTFRTSKAVAIWIWENSFNLVEFGSSDVLSSLPKRVQLGVLVLDDSAPAVAGKPFSSIATHPYYPGLNWLARKRYQAYRTLHRTYYERGVALETLVKEGRWPIPSPPSVPMISLAQCDFDSAGWMVRWHTISPMQVMVVSSSVHKAWLERVVGEAAVAKAAETKAYPYFFEYDAMANRMALMADWLAEGRKDTLIADTDYSLSNELPEGFEPKTGTAAHLLDQFMNDFVKIPNSRNDNTVVAVAEKKTKKAKTASTKKKNNIAPTKSTKSAETAMPTTEETQKSVNVVAPDNSKPVEKVPFAVEKPLDSPEVAKISSAIKEEIAVADADIAPEPTPTVPATGAAPTTPRIKIVHLSLSSQVVSYIVEVFPLADNLLRFCGDDSMLFMVVSGVSLFLIAAIASAFLAPGKNEEDTSVTSSSPKRK